METASPSRPHGKLLWEPSPESIASTNLTRYLQWLEKKRGLKFAGYPELWQWSVNEIEAFWTSIADFFEVRFHTPPTAVLSSHDMPGAHWFPGATLNYAEHLLRDAKSDEGAAILFEAEGEESRPRQETISKAELARRVAAVAAGLRRMGIKSGDRVAGYLPNNPEGVIAFLAAASIGAVWSNCPVELTSRGVLDRLVQIEPKVLFTITHYRYGGKNHDRRAIVEEIAAGLPSLQHCVLVLEGESPSLPKNIESVRWNDLLAATNIPELTFESVPFEHPLWILYSSGTTGMPKAIVQGHGGILLEHLKVVSLHLDLRTGDRFFWYTSSGWMMWNLLVSGLLLPGVTIVLYDGSPKYPNFEVLWDLVERHDISYFGSSAPYLLACMKEGVHPSRSFSLKHLRSIGSTGSPLPSEGFEWVYENVKQDLILGSISGGTDVCSAIVLSNPLLPVEAGKIQCLGLGAKIEAWTDDRKSVLGRVGEFVLTEPFPSMPVFFWNDLDGSRMRASYFEHFPGAWRHGDWIEIESPSGPCVIHGRSDATLNRGGVRMGTADFYAVVEDLSEIAEALVIDMSGLGREDRLLLFVALRTGFKLDEALRARINGRLRANVSPRHVPDAIYAVPALPRTINGKKLEVPIKRILTGMAVDKVVNRGTLTNPETLQFFIDLAATFPPATTQPSQSP